MASRFVTGAWVSLAFMGLALAAFPASAAVISFENLQTGATVGSQYFASNGLLIAAENNVATAPDVAIIFNSNATNTPSNGDLAYPWEGGNLFGVREGKTLVVARDLKDPNGDGLVDVPDAQHFGGKLFFSFSQPLISFGFDAIHVHDDRNEPQTSLIQFYHDGTLVGTVPYSAFTDPSSQFYDPTVVWGDHFANRLQPITAADLGVTSFNAVVLTLSFGSAVDNLTYQNGVSAPEPTAAAILLGILIPASVSRRRRIR